MEKSELELAIELVIKAMNRLAETEHANFNQITIEEIKNYTLDRIEKSAEPSPPELRVVK